MKCRRDGNCEITLETRRRCKSCRLKKCFAVGKEVNEIEFISIFCFPGMRKEWILTEEEKLSKKLRIEENRRLRMNSINPSPPLAIDTTTETKSNLDLHTVVLEKNPLGSVKPTSLSVAGNDVINDVIQAFNDGFKFDPMSYGWSYPLAKKLTAICQILNTKNTTALRLISFYKRLAEFDALHDYDKVNLIKNNLPYIFLFHGSLG